MVDIIALNVFGKLPNDEINDDKITVNILMFVYLTFLPTFSVSETLDTLEEWVTKYYSRIRRRYCKWVDYRVEI
jgi:hypothetical protein